MLPTNVIEDILNKADIVAIVGERIQLSKKGRNYWAVCPFHQDSNPSLSVSPDKRIYKCFSCQVSGNAINFIENFENISFYQAIIKVAASINFDISKYQNTLQKPNSSGDNKIYEINLAAMNFFKSSLVTSEGQVAIEYLKNRNISLEQIEKFDIGFISSKSDLVSNLFEKGYNPKDIIDSGIGNYNESKNQITNVFSDRLMFAIKDVNNNIIGFSGRKIENNSERPKYLNTCETNIFEKRKIAYNFTNAVKTARIKKELIILEGYMDVISMDRIGINNVVALMGTTLSQFHINLFKTIKDVEIKVFLDGDEPGVNAAIKASSLLIANKIKTSIVHNTTNNDPDELINNNRREYLNKIIKKSIDPLEYVLEQKQKKLKHENIESISKFIQEVGEFAVKTDNSIILEKAINSLSKICKISSDSVFQKIKDTTKYLNNNKTKIVYENKRSAKETISKDTNSLIKKAKSYEASELAVVEDLLKSSKNYEYIAENLQPLLNNFDYRTLVNRMIALYKENLDMQTIDLLSELRSINTPKLNDTLDDIINSLTFKMQNQDPRKRLEDAFDKLKERSNEKDIIEIEAYINDPNTSYQEKIKFNELLEKRIKKREIWKQKFSNKERRK